MTAPVRLLLVAAAVLLDGEGRVLLAQRPQGKSLSGLWEFPGGKIEAGERPEAALARELARYSGLSINSLSVIFAIPNIMLVFVP